MKTDAKTNEVEVEVPDNASDINSAYDQALMVLSTKPPKEEKKEDKEQDNKDYYASFRTRYVEVSLYQ